MTKFYLDPLQIQLSWQSFLDNLPYSCGIKNSHAQIVAANNITAYLTGFKKAQELIGLTDAELKCPAAQFHENFYQQDMLALTGKEQRNLDICEYADGELHALISIKKKILDDNENPFIFITTSEVPVRAIMDILKNSPFNICGSYSITRNLLSDKQPEYHLTTRQQEVLFYLLQGKTMKQIAYSLKITSRTVEEHLKVLKAIFGCHSKSQLIEYAFYLGYAYIIPPSLFTIGNYLVS